MKENFKIKGAVKISGVINDEEFSAKGEASGNPETGEFMVRLDYTNFPKGWHPFMYMDVKVGLLFLKEICEGQNLLSLAEGNYTAAGSIDLGNGNMVRNHARIKMLDKDTFNAVYLMHGIAHTGELLAMEYFEETMLPMDNGVVAALGIARWKTKEGKPLDAMLSTKYNFDPKLRLKRAQFRRIEATPKLEGMSFTCTYKGFVQDLPRPEIHDKGAYIGHLIG